MKKWEIQSISIKNLGPFIERQTLSFLAPSKEKNQLFDNLPNLFLNKIKYKFNNIIGIFGPNASGKTQLLEAFKNYLKYNNLNPQIHYEALNYFFAFTNLDSYPSEIEVKYISSEGWIIHRITFTMPTHLAFNPNNVADLTNQFFEQIIFINANGIEQTIFDSSNLKEKINYYRYKNSFAEMFNFQLNMNDIEKENIPFFNKQKEFFEIISNNFLNSNPWKIDIDQNWDSREFSGLQELIDLALKFSLIQNEVNFNKAIKENKMDEFNKSLNEVKNFITKIAQICDPNIDRIDFNLNINSITNLYNIKNAFVTYKDNQEIMHPISSLSSGTLTLMITLLRMYCDVKQNNHSLFIFDELGKSWHSQLLTNFLVFYATTPIFKNTKIIFTSHHPEAGDLLRTDATWFISKNHELISAYNHKNEEGNSTKRNKFSKNYNDSLVDIFSTSPSITDFENIESFFETNEL